MQTEAIYPLAPTADAADAATRASIPGVVAIARPNRGRTMLHLIADDLPTLIAAHVAVGRGIQTRPVMARGATVREVNAARLAAIG